MNRMTASMSVAVCRGAQGVTVDTVDANFRSEHVPAKAGHLDRSTQPKNVQVVAKP